MKARPFLTWAGGKRQLLPELLKRIPQSWNPETDFYYEPFLGGGALFWELQPKNALLGDANEELFIAWLGLENCYVEATLLELRRLADVYKSCPDKQGFFWQVRENVLSTCEVSLRAARTIFLNKTCFNGLYRVNKSGQFNVPWGKNPNANVFDEENLRACAAVLAAGNIQLEHNDFERDRSVSRGSLVYFDPPYVPISTTSNFTSYTVDGFSYTDQLRLVVYASNLKATGVHVILSQAADEDLINQYRRCGFTCDLVEARRAINSKGSKRGPVGEYIIY